MIGSRETNHTVSEAMLMLLEMQTSVMKELSGPDCQPKLDME